MLRALACIVLFVFVFPLYGQHIVMDKPTSNTPEVYCDQEQWDSCYTYLKPLFYSQPEFYFALYVKVLWNLKKSEELEAVCVEMQKYFPDNVYAYAYQMRLYHLKNISGHKLKSLERKLYKRFQNNIDQIHQLCLVFSDFMMYVRDAQPSAVLILDEADLLYKKGDIEAMVNRYLDAAELQIIPWPEIYQRFQTCLGYDDNNGGFKNPILLQQVYERVQRNPDQRAFQEFLQFLYLHRGELSSALKHAETLDRRYQENGFRYLNIAHAASELNQTEIMFWAYSALLKKGKLNPYYIEASLRILEYRLTPIERCKHLTLTQADSLNAYIMELQEHCPDILNKVKLEDLRSNVWWYLNPDKALSIASEIIEWSALTPMQRAEYKLKLSDRYIMNNLLWDAQLYNAQVEKDFKYESIAQEAKFKNAQISFYQGEFNWSKTQADILKGATSKLISNDAIALSLLIGDALAIDSNEAPLRVFSRAMLHAVQGRFDVALAVYDSVNSQFNSHSLADDVMFQKAQIFLKLHRYSEALDMFNQIHLYYAFDLYGDDALWKIICIYEQLQFSKTDLRQKAYAFLERYPGSIYIPQVQNCIKRLEPSQVH
jgi:hypothetical protein